MYYFGINGSIIYNDIEYTSNEINEYVNRIRCAFGDYNIDDNEIVAIALPKSEKLFWIIYAMYFSKIPFLILDMDLPYERLKYMLECCSIRHIVSMGDCIKGFNDYNILDVNELLVRRDTNIKCKEFKSEIAYILFTSGTTGKPKAVCIPHSALINFIMAIPNYVKLLKGQKMLAITNISFDIFLLEVFVYMDIGGEIIIPNSAESSNPRKTVSIIKKRNIQVIQLTPSRLRMLLACDKKFLNMSSLEVIMIGGESLPRDMLSSIQQNTSAQIYNMYGPTETTIWSSVANLTNSEIVNIGQPIDNTRIYILSNDLKPVREGEIGEICIAGDGLAVGYLNDEKKTAASFVYTNIDKAELVYKTGDLGKKLNNTFYCLGRDDQQVKLFGHRIELEEIDSIILDSGLVKEVVNCYDVENEKIICFYINIKEIEDGIFIKYLSNKLPTYMIPAKFCRTTKFLYTSSGKIDRNGMVKEYEMIDSNIDDKKGKIIDDTKNKELLDFISKKLRVECDYQSSLRDMRIPSITFIKLITEIEDKYEIEFDIEKLDTDSYNTIGDLIEYIMLLM